MALLIALALVNLLQASLLHGARVEAGVEVGAGNGAGVEAGVEVGVGTGRSPGASSSCRCLSTQSCWPSSETWEAFNASLGGALIAVQPLASPCHDPNFDEAACKILSQQWSDPFWRADQPAALQSPTMEMDGEQGCSLSGDRSSSCSHGSLPVFVVDANKASQVEQAVAFAAEHNLRLVVKNTGHDFTGKNTAPGSLSIWTHHLKDISFSDKYTPTECAEDDGVLESWSWLPSWLQKPCNAARGTPSVKVGAGVQWEELYRAAHEHQKTLVGAQCASVGAAGGYPLGGGHSQISPTFGLAADNVLEFEVVRSNGKLVVANSCKNKELFWALRGGGGGTFGVVTSVTYSAHPALSNLVFASYIVTTTPKSSPSAFRDLLQNLLTLNPGMSDSGWGGFFIVASKTLIIQYLLPNKDLAFAEKSLGPLTSYLKDRKEDLVVVNGGIKSFPSYYEWHQAVQCSNGKCGFTSGFPVLEASRLIPRTVVEESASKLAEVLISLQEKGYQRVSGYLVGGGKVSKGQESTSVNPAWRKALLHVLFVKPYAENSTLEMRKAFAEELSSDNKLLSDLTPGSGCYLNEADRNDPSWQSSFFGSNYEQLKKIKKQVDPKGLFVCNHCVGSEEWSPELNCRVAEY